MSYFTRNELLQQLQAYVLQIEQDLERENFLELIDEIPFAVVLSKPDKIEFEHINKAYEQLTGYNSKEIKGNENYLEEIVHPVSLRNIRAFLPEFYIKQNKKKTFLFVQYAKTERGEKYNPLITFTKTPNAKNNSVIRLVVKASDFEHLSPKLKQIIKIDQFKLKHFQKFQQLSGREVEVLSLIVNGYNNPQIADILFLARQTIETHRKNIKRKLDLKTFRDLMKYAMAFNLIEF